MQGMVSVRNLVKTFVSKEETVTALNNVTLSTPPPNRILTLLGAFRMREDHTPQMHSRA